MIGYIFMVGFTVYCSLVWLFFFKGFYHDQNKLIKQNELLAEDVNKMHEDLINLQVQFSVYTLNKKGE